MPTPNNPTAPEREKRCGCWWNPGTGYFEPCCQQHEDEYVEYLKKKYEDPTR